MLARLPHPKQVRDMLADLLDREVEVGIGDPVVPSRWTPAAVAVYVDDKVRTATVGVFDVRLAAYSGGALGLVPAEVAKESVENNQLSPLLAENVYEVANIAAALFNVPDAPHLKLHKLYSPGELPPVDVSAMLRSVGRRLDVSVTIPGYGRGHLSFVVAA